MKQTSSMAQFMLSIYSVKLTVKFPCRMSLHHDGKPITGQIQAKDNIFTFNHDVTVKVNPKDDVEISAYLSTGKGGSILAGLISSTVSALAAKEGQRFSLPLQKCIDTSSIVQLKVNHAWIPQERPAMGMARSQAGGVFIRSTSPNFKTKLKTQNDQAETRSQIQANIPRRVPTLPLNNNFTGRDNSFDLKRFSFPEVGNSKFSPKNDFRNEFKEQFEEDSRQTKTIGGGPVSRLKRQKDKQRMQKFAAKKISDQTENNLKMDIMKYKMKSQQMQKAVTEKSKTIKQLREQILEIERKNIEKAYIQQELSSKENTIKVLEDRLSNLNTENISLREALAQNSKSINQLKQNIRFDILKNKQEHEKKQQTLRLQLTECRSRIVELEADQSTKQTQLLKARKYIEDLQASAQQKIFQHDKIIQDLKKQYTNSMKVISLKASQFETKIQQLQKEIANKNNEISKLNDGIAKYEHNTKIMDEKNQILEMQKSQLSAFKVDFQNLTKKYAKLEENLRDEQRNSKKILESKSKQVQDNYEVYNKNLKNLEAKLAAQAEKNKEQKTKIQQLQNIISLAKAQEEKFKKSLEKSQRYSQQLLVKLQNAQKQQKSHELKHQNLEKQLTNITNNSTHMQSLYKLQLEHSKQYTITLSKELQQISSKYSSTKEQLELIKNQKVKLENKIHLMDDNINRLNEYIKEKKVEFENKENQYKESIKNLNKSIKHWEENDKNKQKEINSWEIKDLTSHNKIDKLEKSLEEANGKIDKYEKVTLVKMQQQKDNLLRELQQTKIKLNEAIEQNKFIANERIKLETQTNKNNKINTVLNEEKVANLNELNKLKSNITRHEKNEEKLTNELKAASEENKRLNVKIENLEKEITKNKQTLNQVMNSVLTYKKGLKQSTEIGSPRKQGESVGLRKKGSYIDNLTSSRVVQSFTGAQTYNANMDIKRISQILQTTSKQQQNTIISQQQSILHYKDTIEKLQKQIAHISITSQESQFKLHETIDHITAQLDEANLKILTITNDYEDRISKLETQINKKEKDIKLHKSTIGSLKYEIETLKKKIQIMNQESDMRQHKNGEKMVEMSNELNFLENSIKNLEGQKRNLENKLYALQDELHMEKEERTKKEKYLAEISEKFTMLSIEHEQITASRKQIYEELLALKQQLHAVKQSNEKNQQLVRNQERNNKKLQQFINQLIKQKENMVKIELQSSSKAIEMESTVSHMKSLLENKDEQLKQKEEQNYQFKNNIKNLQTQIKNYQAEIKECNTKINNLTTKIQEKEKKIAEKEYELKDLSNQYTALATKSKQQLRNLKEEYETLRKRSQIVEQENETKIFTLQKRISDLESELQTTHNELIQKQEQIFFQKQRASLSESTLNDMKKGQSEVNLIISKYEAEINQLNQQLTQKEQFLYEYSGKIYQLEQRLQAKQAEIAIRQEKVDIDWQCRHDQVCEEYEQKIELLEKEKKYIKDKLDLIEQEKIKVQSQKEISAEQHEKDIGNIKAREKQLEEEKLKQLNLKNKQVQSLKNEIALTSNQLKNLKIEMKKKQSLVASKDEVIKKLQVKIQQIDRGTETMKKQYELQINNLKKNENIVKSLKEDIKNAQWVTQRQTKKITQVFIQKVVNCFPQAKEKLSQPIRAMENSMAAAINFKI